MVSIMIAVVLSVSVVVLHSHNITVWLDHFQSLKLTDKHFKLSKHVNW
jgi:hypothetical protein